jgi:PiT family inorganic phosphate transporter
LVSVFGVEKMDLLVIALVLAGLYMAWNIGANDLANAMGTSVGTGALSIKKVIIIASVFEFLGAVFFGGRVTSTIAKGIVPIDKIANVHPDIVAVGMLAAILAAGFWVTLTTFYNLPVSTSHSIVGSVLGFGLVVAFNGTISFSDIHWGELTKIVTSWFISPVLGAIVAYITFSAIRRLFIHRAVDLPALERKFISLQLITACYMAFAHGSNDVANAIGPLAAALQVMNIIEAGIPIWILVLGGIGIVIGMATWGYKVVETIGSKITELTPTRGFSAEFATASVVLLNSYIALPISTTHTLVGSVIGVGLAGGIAAVDLRVIWRIISSWIATVPVAALTSALIFVGLEVIFL